MKVKRTSSNFTVLPGIEMPAKEGDAGYDLRAQEIIKSTLFSVWYTTHLAMEIPPGHVGLVVPRSSITNKGDLTLANSVGIIDSGFRGAIQVRFNRTLKGFFSRGKYEIGDKVAQLVIVPFVAPNLEFVDELDNTKRGENGFGHTGK